VRYVVGIDLGTTNCGLAFVDSEAPDGAHAMTIAQVVGPGEVAARPTLPSFLLLPTEHEVAADAMSLPWAARATSTVGTYAQSRGAELPHRLVSSAKSWLSSSNVDRAAAILPWRGADRDLPEGGDRVSPIAASTRYLAHLRAAWDATHRDHPLADQDVLLTVPASFDPVARELTVLAARDAGLPRVTLLEEPQSAFYAWLAAVGDTWRSKLVPGDVVLVCDIGGGTTDFTLIEITDDGGALALERVAVGDHILLGGDNMDLALAASAERTLADRNQKLDSLQSRGLVHACRRAKEQLLAVDGPATVPVAIVGRGSKLIGSTVRVDLERAAAHTLLIDGFFPRVGAEARPTRRRSGGLREVGLAYAADPAVTKHLAEFLDRHDSAPTAVLWNGGVMKSSAIRTRIREAIGDWYGRMPRELDGADLDLAVAIGAAHYGQVRRGGGVRIRGGTARAYYIGVESAAPAIPGFAPPIKALCVAPFGMEEGTSADLPDDDLGLIVGEPSTFRFFASTTRKDDPVGALVAADDDGMVEIDPVEQAVPAEGDRRAGDLVPVVLSATVTDVGTLELWCRARAGGGRWKLEYSLRERT
jgi:molecular chaperone DnaK (HSP70)